MSTPIGTGGYFQPEGEGRFDLYKRFTMNPLLTASQVQSSFTPHSTKALNGIGWGEASSFLTILLAILLFYSGHFLSCLQQENASRTNSHLTH